jgi:hypothetical protein
MINSEKAGPIEVWLTQKNMAVTCIVVNEDESTREPDIHSLSMRGAQREITGWLIRQGYKPDGRWSVEHSDSPMSAVETWRRFKPAAA